MRLYKIKRYIMEEFEVEAKNRTQAIEILNKEGRAPTRIDVLRESATLKSKEEKK